jgi:hypothetical protein
MSITTSNNAMDIINFDLKVLLFQAGYLTIESATNSSFRKYYLKRPNLKVAASMASLELSIKEPFSHSILHKKQTVAMLDFFPEMLKGFKSC